MSKYKLEDIDVDSQRGILRCSPGATIQSVRQAALVLGWDLRIYPTAIPQEGTIGGFIGTTIWGAGSLVYGSLQSPGNFHGLDVMSVTKHSETFQLREDLQGPDPLACFLGTQGTLGVISKLEIGLSPATSTTSFVFSFPELRYAINTLAPISHPGLILMYSGFLFQHCPRVRGRCTRIPIYTEDCISIL
jgi:FAD/FMN-containing dehydrogenase